MSSVPRSAVLASPLLAWLLLAGCTPRAVVPTPPAPTAAGVHHVDVLFTQNASGVYCPTGVDVPAPKSQCFDPSGKHVRDCVVSTRGDKVVFSSRPATAGGPTDLPFTVWFDPFKKGALSSRPSGPAPLPQQAEATVDLDAPAKAYVYSVTAPNCPPLDPRIIVM